MKKFQLCICLSMICMLLTACTIHKSEPEKRRIATNKIEKEQEKAKDNKEAPKKQLPKETTISTLYGVEIGEKISIDMKQSIQENSFYCGPAVVQMILQHFHISKTQKEFADEMNTVPITGTEYDDMARILNTYLFQKEKIIDSESGYRVQTLNVNETNKEVLFSIQTRIRQNIQDGYPSILAVDLNALYPEQVSANHFVVCNGYVVKKDSDEVAFYYIIDPYYEVQDAQYGGVKVFTPEELQRAIVSNVEPAYIW